MQIIWINTLHNINVIKKWIIHTHSSDANDESIVIGTTVSFILSTHVMKTKPDNVANTGQIICRLSALGQCRLKSNQEKNAFAITISASVFYSS